jgi:hypothetical protein
MTNGPHGGRLHVADRDHLIARLEGWLREQRGRVMLADLLQTGDGELFAGYALELLRVGVRRGAYERIGT